MNTSVVYNNAVVQYAAGILLFVAILGTMILFGYQTVTGGSIGPWEQTFLVTALTLSANVLGYHQGAVNTTQATATAIQAVNGGTNVPKP
jgi:hypothetical protein